MSACRNIFPSDYRLRRRGEFRLAANAGRKIHSRHFIIFVRSNENGPTRLGVTVSRKVGGAVQRNRIKRLVREFFRSSYQKLPQNTDISIIAKKGQAELNFHMVRCDLEKALFGLAHPKKNVQKTVNPAD